MTKWTVQTIYNRITTPKQKQLEMGNIVNDIVEEIDIKPNKSKQTIKIVASVASSLIVVAFAFGQFKASFFNRVDNLETKIDNQSVKIDNIKTSVNTRIDKAYDDGTLILTDFQQNVNQQLGLIIDYGDSNSDMLKRMLELNKMNINNELLKAKNQNPRPRIGEIEIIPVEEEKGRDFSIDVTPLADKPFISEVYFIDVEGQDTIFNINGATQKYINSIDKNKYNVGAKSESGTYPGRYDFSYSNK